MGTSRVHETAIIGDPPEARGFIGLGVYPDVAKARLGAYVTVDSGTKIRTRIGNSWLMKHVHVGHDAQIGDGCELAPGVVIGGWVKMGDNVKVGINSCVKPRVTIGDGARIGAGAVVVKDVPAGMTVVGNPARDIKIDPRIDPLWYEWLDGRG